MHDGGEMHPCKRYGRMFSRFFKNLNMSSTYKPVLLGAIVDVAKWGTDERLAGGQWVREEGGRVHVGLDFLAARFAKFYWDIAVGFSMRHTPERMADQDDPGKDANIVGIIRDEIEAARAGQDSHGAGKGPPIVEPPSLEELASEGMGQFRRRVITEAIRPEVLGHLHGSAPGLYERPHGRDYIVLEADMVEYMRDAEHMLRASLKYKLAKRLEGLNPAARHIAIKIDMDISYDDRIRRVADLEARAMADGRGQGAAHDDAEEVIQLCKASSEITARLARLAAAQRPG